ncbi:MAG: GNAT family N-acetyltransferase [Alphaproteobacteria bacterium]|nr:GNAT family N-acetyltransferase [Alphaproteobacteria bacterium]
MPKFAIIDITFARLPTIPADEIIAHMSDPQVAAHMPLLTFQWDHQRLAEFVAAKEECWRRDGLGHWAILNNGDYVGWGGFQKEGSEWDFGLVLKPGRFGLGTHIVKKAISFARDDPRIPFVTFLLPPSRKRVRGLLRRGAIFVGEVDYNGTTFMKYRLQT